MLMKRRMEELPRRLRSAFSLKFYLILISQLLTITNLLQLQLQLRRNCSNNLLCAFYIRRGGTGFAAFVNIIITSSTFSWPLPFISTSNIASLWVIIMLTKLSCTLQSISRAVIARRIAPTSCSLILSIKHRFELNV